MTWDNPQDDCPLCEMAEETHWYHEDRKVVIADALSTDEPFVVLKSHTTDPTDFDLGYAEGVSEYLFGECDFSVKMNVVDDHWHAHIVDPEVDPDHLKDE